MHLPPDIAFVVATESMQTQLLSDEEETYIADAVEKRKRDFRGGRHAAKLALQQLGFDQKIALLPVPGTTRPDWPVGYVGSITHTPGFCAAAVARSSDYAGIGIDAETRVALKAELLSKICTDREQAWIAQQSEDRYWPYWGKIIFSIKESLYKVFNPIHQVFLGFEEAEVCLSPLDGSFAADIFQREKRIKCRYIGSFGINTNFIFASTLLKQGSAGA